MENYSKSVLKVGGLSGNEGSKEIEDTFHEIDGVKSVNVNMNDRTVSIEYNPEVIREDFIKRTLNSLGYSPFIFPKG